MDGERQLAGQAHMELFLIVLVAAVAGAIWAATRDRRRHGLVSGRMRRSVKASQPSAEPRKPRASVGRARQ
jgi:hypothetical protein